MESYVNDITLYGIKNCETVRRAFTWLEKNNFPYAFYDYKKNSPDYILLSRWCEKEDWRLILNFNSTTFRKLNLKSYKNLNRELAIQIMLKHPSIIKRPILEYRGFRLIGFRSDTYASRLL